MYFSNALFVKSIIKNKTKFYAKTRTSKECGRPAFNFPLLGIKTFPQIL
jgi:hypothetical protein